MNIKSRREGVKNVEEVKYVNMVKINITAKNVGEVVYVFIINKNTFVKSVMVIIFVFIIKIKDIAKNVMVVYYVKQCIARQVQKIQSMKDIVCHAL